MSKYIRANSHRKAVLFFVMLSFVILLVSCGGGSSSLGSGGGNGGSGGSGGGSGGSGGGTGSNGPLAVNITSVTMTNAPGQSINLPVKLTVPTGFTTPVTGSLSGLPAGVTVYPHQPLTLLPGAQTVYLQTTVGSTTPAAGTYTLTMTATAGTQQVTGTGTLTITPAPPQALTTPVNSIYIAPGQSNSINLACVTPTGTTCTLNTTISGLPSGITVSPVPPFNVTSQGRMVTFTVAGSVPTGQYPITFVGKNGSYSTTFNLTLIIQDGSYWLDSPSPNSVTVRTGGTATVKVGTGFSYLGQTPNYNLNLSVTGLPSGTSITFANSIVPGQSTTMTITAAANAPISHNNSVLVTATPSDGGTAYSTSFLLNVDPPPGQLATSRSDIVPTDGDIVSAVYDPIHQVVFGSNPMWNRVDVISPATRMIVKSIQVPSPKKLSMSLDGTKILVGTNTSLAYWIDTTTMQVARVVQFPVGSGITVPEIDELSSGRFLLIAYSNYTYTPVVCASDASSCNKLPGMPFQPNYFLVSANGTKVLLGLDASPASAAIYDVASETIQSTAQVRVLAIDPTGTYCVVMNGGNGSGVSLYDMQLVLQRNLIPDGMLFGMPAAVFSPDGKTVYMVATSQYTMGTASTYTVDVGTGALTGMAPTLATWIGSNNYESEIPYTTDGGGLLFGGISHGLAIDDSTFYNIVPLGSSPVSWLTVNSGPVNTTTQTAFGGTAYDYLPDVYFGGLLAPTTLSSGTLNMTVPASSAPGPVNIKMEFPNGSEGFAARAFTYGSWLQLADGSAADVKGGAKASVLGLGLGTDASHVQVSVGGTAAQVVGVTQLTNGLGMSSIYPFPSSSVTYVVPPGIAGPADISVTTPAGTSTIKGGMRYSQVEDYSSSDTFTAVLYDRWRNRLYLTAGDHIDVFDLTSDTFGTPIVPPTLNGKSGFAGTALTPDGSKLLIVNTTDGSLALVNPDTPTSASAVLVAPPEVNGSCVLGPMTVATTSDNRALVSQGTSPVGCGLGANYIYSVDLSSGISSPLTMKVSCGLGNVNASRDGSKVVLSPPNFAPCVYDVTSNNFFPFGSGYDTATAISGDGTLAEASQYSGTWDIASSSGSVVAHGALPDILPAGVTLSSAAMNDSGSLLYLANAAYNGAMNQSISAFVDVVDVNHGDVRSRIRLTENIQSVLRPLAVDPTDARIFLITDKGLTVITVSGVPLSIGSVTPTSGTAGTVVTVRGSGFQPGMTAQINGASATVVVVDSQTAHVTIPPLNSGAAKMALTNTDGTSYSLEAAFTVN